MSPFPAAVGAPAAARYAELTFDGMASAVPRGLPAAAPGWTRSAESADWIRQLPPPAADPSVDWSAAGPGTDRGTEPVGRSTGVPLDLPGLAALLSFGAGASCVEFGPQSSWRHHRVAPSARCIFPCSVWIVGRNGEHSGQRGGHGRAGQDPDVSRYHPEHHQLRSRVPFRHRRWTRIHCVVTAEPGTTGAHYGDYAYRLVCQEAGLLLGSLLLAARALGLRAEADLAHSPDEIDQLLSLDGRRECSIAMISLSGAVTEAQFPAPDTQGPHVQRPCTGPASMGALSSAAHRAFGAARPRVNPTGDGAGPAARAVPSPVRLPWRRLRAARDSGDPGFIPSPLPVGAGTLERLCSAALTTAFPDVWRGLPPVSLLSARRNVPGAEQGLFRYDEADCRSATPPAGRRLLADSAVTPFLRRCQMVASTNAHEAPATVFIAVDLASWLRHDAARAYTDLHLRTGEAALRLLMAASAEGLVARIHNGFLTGPLREVCGPGHWIVPFAVLLSRRRPSARYRFVLDGGL